VIEYPMDTSPVQVEEEVEVEVEEEEGNPVA
jgi:hypothetical protein